MIRVRTRGNEPLDKMLRRFKKKCENEGLVKEIKRAAIYEKPSELRRRKLRRRDRKIVRAAAEAELL
ncbi:30S ribosomal protein S21 [Planctomycetota bacterium]